VVPLSLSGNTSTGLADLVADSAFFYQLRLQNCLALMHTQVSTGATIASSNGNLMTYLSGTGTLTLPALTTSYPGWACWVSNPGAGTLSVSAAQNIVGQGVSGTTSSVPTLTNALFVAHNNAGTMYWARYV